MVPSLWNTHSLMAALEEEIGSPEVLALLPGGLGLYNN